MTDFTTLNEHFEALKRDYIAVPKETLEAQQAEIARLREALTTLKGHCNKHIKSINQGAGIHTPSFAQINMLLKQCDEAFKALEQKP